MCVKVEKENQKIELESKLALLERELDNTNLRLSAEFGAHELLIDELSSAKGTAVEAAQALEDKRQSWENQERKFDSLRNRLAEYEEDLADAINARDEAVAKITTMVGVEAVMTKECERLREELKRMGARDNASTDKKKIDDLEKELKSAKDEARLAEEKIDNLESKLHDVLDTQVATGYERDIVSKQLGSLSDENAQLMEKLQSLKNEVNDLRVERDEMAMSGAHVNKKLDVLGIEKVVAEQQVSDFARKITELEVEVKRLRQLLKASEANLTSMRAENSKQLARLESQTERLKRDEDALQAAIRDVEDLKGQLVRSEEISSGTSLELANTISDLQKQLKESKVFMLLILFNETHSTHID